MQSYSQDLRDRVLRALARGDGPSAIAERFEVSRFYVYQVRDREQQTGVRSSFQIGGHRRSRLQDAEPVLRRWIAAEPGLTRHHQVTAPMVVDGPMDGELFLAWIEQFLCPHCSQETSSSSTTSVATKLTGSSRPSPWPVPGCSICPPIRPT